MSFQFQIDTPFCRNWCYNNLQSALRTVARLVMKLPGHASVNEVMKKDLHWLGFPQWISYKLCTTALWHTSVCSGILDEAFYSCFFSRWTLTLEVCCRWSSCRPDHENKNNRNKKFPLFGTYSLEQSSPSIVWLFSDFWKFQNTTENLLVLNCQVICIQQLPFNLLSSNLHQTSITNLGVYNQQCPLISRFLKHAKLVFSTFVHCIIIGLLLLLKHLRLWL